MQLELDFDPQPTLKKLFFMTSGLFTNELCYTINTDYGNASGYNHNEAIEKLLQSGYTKQAAESLLKKAKRSKKWIVYQYQQCFNF